MFKQFHFSSFSLRENTIPTVKHHQPPSPVRHFNRVRFFSSVPAPFLPSFFRTHLGRRSPQRADVYVGDVCHSTEKVGTVTPRVRTTTNTPTASKTTTPVPADVSQMSPNVSKTETEERESESYQCEQDQQCDGDEVYAVKGKGKGRFKGSCFKCGMRGHKADRCW